MATLVRTKVKTLTWKTLLIAEANRRIEQYVNVKGEMQLKSAIMAACPLRGSEETRYKLDVWRAECRRLVEVRRHPPKPGAFKLELQKE